MNTKRLVYPLIVFLSGLAAGVLWSPLGEPTEDARSTAVDPRSLIANEEYARRVEERLGVEAGVFVRQGQDMEFRVKQYPIDAWASRDGRFVIRLFGSNETTASELYSPDLGGIVKEVVRHYSYTCGDRTFSCDIGHVIDSPKITNVIFRCTDSEGGELRFIDSDGDGRWDRFYDETQEPPRSYERDGLSWKERKR